MLFMAPQAWQMTSEVECPHLGTNYLRGRSTPPGDKLPQRSIDHDVAGIFKERPLGVAITPAIWYNKWEYVTDNDWPNENRQSIYASFTGSGPGFVGPMEDVMAQIIRIDEKTVRIEDGGVRFFLLEGTEKALLVDTGMNTPDAKAIAESLTTLPLSLINTHADRDHISGNSLFDTFYISPAEAENYASGTQQPVSDIRAKILPVQEGDLIDLGDRPLLVIDNPGHTPGSIAILDVKNRVLIGGDSIQDGNIFLFGKYRNIDQYVGSLKHIREYGDRFDVVYPSHGTFPVKPELIEDLIDGAQKIIAGAAESTVTEWFGMKIRQFRFPYAGFLCDL